MTQFAILGPSQVITLHDYLIGRHELQGLSKDKSLDAVLERVHNRVRYGFIVDAYELAACYASFIAKGHCFNEANKRTAAATLFFVLKANQIEIQFKGHALGEWIVAIVNDEKTETELAVWLRQQAHAEKK
jgi:death-on-curing protein